MPSFGRIDRQKCERRSRQGRGLAFRYYRITLFKKANSAGCAFTVNLIPKLRQEARESRAELALAAPGFWCHDIGICRATTIKRANTNALILIL
jgi:hypothetical protein